MSRIIDPEHVDDLSVKRCSKFLESFPLSLVTEFKSICHKVYVVECATNLLYKPSKADFVR